MNFYILTSAFLLVAHFRGSAQAQQPALVGTVTKQYFWFLPDKTYLSQAQASALCKKNGMLLASIKTAEEQSILQSMASGKTLNGNQGYNFYISASNVGQSGQWTWIDQSPVCYNNWNQYWGKQPSGNAGANCAIASATYWGQGSWFDTSCTAVPDPTVAVLQPYLALCEKITTNFNQPGV